MIPNIGKQLFISLLFITIGFNLYAQSSQKTDSLYQLLTHPSLSKQVDALNELALFYAKTDSAKAYGHATKAKDIALKTNYYLGLGRAYRAMGIAQTFRHHEKEALHLLNQAINYFQKNNNSNEIGLVYADIGVFYKLLKDQPTALWHFQKAADIHLKNKNQISLIADYNNLGATYSDMGQKSQAIEIYIKGLKLTEKLGVEGSHPELLMNLGNLMQSEKNYAEANRYYRQALAIFTKQNNQLNIGITNLNLANSYILTHQYTEGQATLLLARNAFEKANFTRGVQICYNNLGALTLRQQKYQEAIPFLQKSLDIIKTSPNKAGQALVEQNIGYAHTKLGNLAEAEKWFEKSESSAKTYKSDINVYAEIYTHRAMLDSAKGDYYNALIRKSKAIKIKDSLLNEKLNLQITELQTKYETEKKQSQIDFLTTQNTIQTLNLKNKTLALNASQLENERNELEIQNKNLDLQQKNITIQQKELKAKNDAQQISLLNEQSIVQRLQLKTRNQTIAIVSALLLIAVILAAAGFILFRNFRAKAKLKQEQLTLENKLLEEQANAKVQEQRLEISRELHDSLGSQLTFISSVLGGLKNSSAKLDEIVNNKINTLSDFSENSINELKNTIWALNAKELYLNDLKLKILNFIKNASEAKEDIQFNFDFNVANNFRLNSKQAVNLFRVFQEIVNNTFKYAKAKNISASIKQHQNGLIMQIADDGIGFNLAEAEQKSYGIGNIKSRIAELNGNLAIETAPNQGTKYEIEISLI